MKRKILSFFKRFLVISLSGLFSCLFLVFPAQASSDYIEVKVSLGNPQGELVFVPNNFEFFVGKKYKLILDNPSPQKHYFTSKDFADASWTKKVQAGKVEVKGAIHELELKPTAEAEWVFIPEKTGVYDLYCSISGHKEAGMTGKIKISN